MSCNSIIERIVELDKKGSLTEEEHQELINLLGVYSIDYIRACFSNLY